MLRTRIAAVASAALLFAAMPAITAAMAQTATGQPAGKPLQLVKIDTHPSRTMVRSHAKTAARSTAGRSRKVAGRAKKHAHLAALRRHRPQLPVKTAAATPAPAPVPVPVPTPPPAANSVWPTTNPAVATEITTAAQSAPAAQPAPAADPAPTAPDPSEVVVAGQTVKVASPEQVNEIDLSARRADAQTGDAATVNAAAGSPPHETSNPAPRSNAVKAFAARTHQPNVGSTSWILQVLAALGGAVTAGTVAWFLIGGTPQRTYG